MTTAETLRSVADLRDEELFVGRSREIGRMARLLSPSSTKRVAYLHGPGGIGKSSLLRATMRHARRDGYGVERFDGLGVGVADEMLESIRRPGAARRLVAVDNYEAIMGVDVELRASIDAVAPTTRVVVAGRLPPPAAWSGRADVMALEVSALSMEDARCLLLRRRVEVDDAVVEWARGEPLALAVAADAIAAGGGFDPSEVIDDQGIARTLIDRLAGAEAGAGWADVLLSASLTRFTDSQILSAMLPRHDPAEAEGWLRSLSFSEEVERGVAVHARVRDALRTLVRTEDPTHYRQLRRRLADHLYERARAEDHRLVTEIAQLIDDPRIQWGLGVEQAATHRADRLRPGDEEAVAAAVAPSQPRRWAYLRRWFRESPQHIVAVRDLEGELAGIGIYATVDDTPRWVAEDPVLGPWAEHARGERVKALLNRGGLVLRWTPGRASVGNSVMLARWAADLQRVYGVGYRDRTTQISFLAAMGYRRMPSLDAMDGEQAVESHLLDLDRGTVGHVHDLVYRDLGLSPERSDTARMIRDALRSFHDPEALAASPLARGDAVAERARSVRELIEAGLAAFGETPDERLTRATIEQGYLHGAGSHEDAATALHMSRSTYFRRLAKAVERLALYLDRSRLR